MADSELTLDHLDRQLVRLLQANARASYQELADAIGTSASTVRRRVERMAAADLITFVAFPNWQAMGFNFNAFVGISVDLPHIRAVCDKLAAMEEICFVTLTTGDYDIVIQVVLPSNKDLVTFWTDRIASIEGIRSMQTLMIPEIIKSYQDYRLPSLTQLGDTDNGKEPGATFKEQMIVE